MKRRLRKKKRIGEFQELGFEVLADLRDGLSPIEFDAFLDRWISAVEAAVSRSAVAAAVMPSSRGSSRALVVAAPPPRSSMATQP